MLRRKKDWEWRWIKIDSSFWLFALLWILWEDQNDRLFDRHFLFELELSIWSFKRGIKPETKEKSEFDYRVKSMLLSLSGFLGLSGSWCNDRERWFFNSNCIFKCKVIVWFFLGRNETSSFRVVKKIWISKPFETNGTSFVLPVFQV